MKKMIVYGLSTGTPKPPSDEGGGSPYGETEGEKLPLSQPDRLTAPLTRGAKGAPCA